MRYLESMICWTPAHWPNGAIGQIEVGPWPDKTGWSRKYRMSFGACFVDRHDMSPGQRFEAMMIEFHHAVVADGIDPKAAHREFAKIDEFRDTFGDETQI